jgi:gamma-glutamyltranspeptidase / glutathione hydrolase
MSEPIAPTRHAAGRVAVATASPLATQVAARVLAQGGSAADAVLAAQAVLCLVEPNASGLGGGSVILWQDACSGAAGVVDGLSCAPARVTTRLELDFDGRMIPAERALTGGRSVGVPGALRALELLHGRFGRLCWADCLAPAIALAEDGVPMPRYLAKTLGEITAMRDESLAQSALLGPDHRPLPSGTVFRNPALARSLREIAEDGAGALYEGRIARAMLDKVTSDLLPGTLTAADLAGYRAVERVPLRARLGDGTVLTAPPPVFGGMAMGQILGLMQAQGFLGVDPCGSAAALHALCESGRLAFADRGAYVGDPAFCAAPAQALLDPGYLAERAGLIQPGAMLPRVTAGRIPGVEPGAPGGGMSGSMTSHLVVTDAQGMTISMTTTINQNFGSRLSAAGFYLNNVMTNFARHPEVKGLAARNALAPGKRAMTSFAPSILLDSTGAVQAAIGAGGGNRIVGFVANGLLRIAAGQTDAAALVAAPQGMCAGSFVDLETPLQPHAAALRQRGHYVMLRRMDGGTQALIRNGEFWSAGGDPRRDGSAAALDQSASA